MARRERFKNGERRAQDAKYQAQVRSCCATNREDPHLPGCVRPISRCANKVAFQSRDAARKRAIALEQPGDIMTAYRCRGCALWHIGHPTSEGEGL